MARILITNNGTHSADKWAMTTAEMIFPLDDSNLVGERLIAAQKFQTQLAELLSPHYDAVMEAEKAALHADAEHFNTLHHAAEPTANILPDVIAAAHGTPWEGHFAKSQVQDAVSEVIDNHVATIMHCDRLWHAAHNPSEHGDRYLAFYHGA